jgi:hypothetical protein
MSDPIIRRAIATACWLGALAVALATVPAPASARTATPTRSVRVVNFEQAVSGCAQRAPRQSSSQVRTCVYDLTNPTPANAELFDLWRIFTNCLSLMADAGPDAMYPTSHYEDEVNDCLGL